MGLILDEEAADTLMELLPPVGWADVATKTDLQHLRDEMQADIKNLRDELKGDIKNLRDELKGDIQNLRVELKGDTKNLREELKADMHALQLTIEITIEKRIHEQTKWLITTMIAMNTVMLAASVALSKLI
jgi:predicted amino acid-binding ACT domain protein